jgi:transcriptional regulator of acetoin/glycerol metabolism
VRQLINALEHCAITCSGDTVEVSDLPDYILNPRRGGDNGKSDDREKILSALAVFKGNKTLTARHLGISRVTLWKKLKEMDTGGEGR